MSLQSYQETSFRSREVRETLCYSPEQSVERKSPAVARKRNFREEKNWVDYTSDERGDIRKEFKSQTTHNIIQVAYTPFGSFYKQLI